MYIYIISVHVTHIYNINTHTHTHTHLYINIYNFIDQFIHRFIYIYICIYGGRCVGLGVGGWGLGLGCCLVGYRQMPCLPFNVLLRY
jgi:hypothetical protein